MDNLEKDKNTNLSLSLIAGYGSSDSESDNESVIDHTGSEGSVELSEMVLKNNIINACAHGPIWQAVPKDEERETTRHMIIDGSEEGVLEYEVTEYRDAGDSSDSSSSSSSDSDMDSIKDIEDVDSDDNEPNNKKDKLEPPKVQGELGLDDLPPIEDLAISLPSQDTSKIGTIISIVDRLVVVRALPETPAVDLDSVLFIDNGAKALGKVHDVFGPVTEPHYCVRFNSSEHVKERGVETGMDVYIGPKSQHTKYVFWPDLIKMKGSDASWLNDVEPPPSQVDYSDDEEERRVKAQRKQNKQQAAATTDTSTDRNQRAPEPLRLTRGRGWRLQPSDGPPPLQRPGIRPPVFNPRVPPPPPWYDAQYGAQTTNTGGMRVSFAPVSGFEPRFRSAFRPRPPPAIRPRLTPRMYARSNAGPVPMFGTNYCNGPQWNSYSEPPPPPGT